MVDAYAQVCRIVRWRIPFVFPITIILVGCGSGSTDLSVENKGQTSMDSVTVWVTGNRYVLGEIPPGKVRVQEIKVKGESHIEISHSGNRRLVLDVYLEPGYGGSIHAEVTPDSVLSVVQETKVGP